MVIFAVRSSAVVALLLLLPALASAQAAITGSVRDTSGAVLPGVTVEAASAALIEQVRSAISDDTGQYRIVALPPGVYTLTFTLPGFSTVKRDGVEVSGTFVATVNGELRVGALEETITVTGETPVVDVQSAKTQQTLSKDIIAAVPTSRLAQSIVRLIPGVMTQTDVGGSAGAGSGASGAGGGLIHGGKADDSRLMQDGLATTHNGGGSGMFMANSGGAQEVVVSTSGGLGEAEVGGVTLNVIPRDGGNIFSGSAFYSFANGAMQGSNYTQELKDQGLTAPNEIVKLYDINPMGGGRIVRDRLWFYTTFRALRADNTVPGMFANRNRGNVNAWTYEPDLTQPTISDKITGSISGRLTLQATPRHKFMVHWDEQWRCDGCSGGGAATIATEASVKQYNHPARFQQATWNSPLTSRVLLEASYGQWMLTWRGTAGGQPRDDANPVLVNAVEQAGSIPGLSYRMVNNWQQNLTNTRTWRASMSYVTGAHNMKFGYFGGYQSPYADSYVLPCPACPGGDRLITSYRFNNGVPNQFTFQGDTNLRNGRNIIPTSFYAQDQWTQGRLTLQGGLRYDHMITSYPELRTGGNRLVPVEIVFPKGSVPGVNFDDITPRMGVAYDLFGNGRTALKYNLGKYPLAQTGSGTLNPSAFGRIVLTSTRSWTDTNRNMLPDCDVANRAKNGECGAMASQSFGLAQFSSSFDPRTVTGWGARPYQWEMGLSVQQEVIPRVSATVGYYRRMYGNFSVFDNRAVQPSDFDPFSIVAPLDPRLPDGGGYTIAGLHNIRPAKFGVTDNVLVPSTDYGHQIEYWHGVDVNIDARLRNGLTVRGGTSTGRRITDDCEIKPDDPTVRFCRIEEPFITQVRGSASYTVPRVDLLMSMAVNSDIQGSNTTTDGSQGGLAANWNVPNQVVKPSLGRDLSGGASNVTVNLIEPATLYGGRQTYIDIRVAKVLRFGNARTQLGLDVFNVFNSSTPQAYNQTYVPGGAWLTPQNILPARFAKISFQFDF